MNMYLVSDDCFFCLQRASDRSWKAMWCVLRGHALFMFKDKNNMVSYHLVLRILSENIIIYFFANYSLFKTILYPWWHDYVIMEVSHTSNPLCKRDNFSRTLDIFFKFGTYVGQPFILGKFENTSHWLLFILNEISLLLSIGNLGIKTFYGWCYSPLEFVTKQNRNRSSAILESCYWRPICSWENTHF